MTTSKKTASEVWDVSAQSFQALVPPSPVSDSETVGPFLFREAHGPEAPAIFTSCARYPTDAFEREHHKI